MTYLKQELFSKLIIPTSVANISGNVLVSSTKLVLWQTTYLKQDVFHKAINHKSLVNILGNVLVSLSKLQL